MTQKTQAIFEHGVFRPTQAIDLPEQCEVELEVRTHEDHPKDGRKEAMQRIFDCLSRSYPGGPPDLAERHNEHQP